MLPYMVSLTSCCVLRVDRLEPFPNDIPLAVEYFRVSGPFLLNLASRGGLRDYQRAHELGSATRCLNADALAWKKTNLEYWG